MELGMGGREASESWGGRELLGKDQGLVDLGQDNLI